MTLTVFSFAIFLSPPLNTLPVFSLIIYDFSRFECIIFRVKRMFSHLVEMFMRAVGMNNVAHREYSISFNFHFFCIQRTTSRRLSGLIIIGNIAEMMHHSEVDLMIACV